MGTCYEQNSCSIEESLRRINSPKILFILVATKCYRASNLLTFDYDHEPISASRLKAAILDLEAMIGKSLTDNVVGELEKAGLDISGSEEYFLHEIRGALDNIFGKDAAELLIERIKKSLESA